MKNSLRWTIGVSALVSLVAVYSVFVIIPVQTYVAVSDCFRYSLDELLLSYGMDALLSFCALTFALSVLGRTRVGYRLHVVVLAFVVAILLEAGILAIGLPQLNGDIGLYRGKLRRCLDSTVWFCIIAGCLMFVKMLARHLILFSTLVLAFASCSLLDVRKQRGLNGVTEDVSPIGGLTIVPRWDVVRSGYYSPSNNVFFLIVDSVTREVVSDIFRTDKELAREFSGFTVYENNLGMHWASDVAIAGMMTGCFLDSPENKIDYVRQQFTTNSFASDFDRCGYPVFVNAAVSSLGLTNCRLEKTGPSIATKTAARDIRMEDACPWSVGELTRFRMIPYALKCKYLKRLLLAWNQEMSVPALIHSDKTLWPYLARLPIDPTARMTLHIHHSPGGHAPIHFDECGNWTQILAPTYENYRRQVVYVFRQLADLMRSYRRRGLYDVSTIVIMADHGGIRSDKDRTDVNLPDAAIPALMVKPRHGHGTLRWSTAPTSHSRIRDLALHLKDRDLSVGEIDAILSQSNRLYRVVLNGGRMCDWIDDCRNGVLCHEWEDRTDRRIRALEYGRTYGLEALGTDPVCDFRGATCIGVRSSGEVRFRLPCKEDRTIRVELEFLVVQGAEAETRGFSVVDMAGRKQRIENVAPQQVVRLVSDLHPNGDSLDVMIDSTRASFALVLKRLKVTPK